MGKYFKEGFKLRDQQIPMAQGLAKRRRALLVDSTGNGKTLATLYAFSYLHSRGAAEVLYVWTPKNAYDKGVWRKDIESFTHLRCISFDSYMSALRGGTSADVLRSSYEVVYGKHTHLKTAYSSMQALYRQGGKIVTVIDEVHACKNPRTELSRGFHILLKGCYALWGLTATILSKDCMDTYNIVNFVSPRYFPTVRYFQDTFCVVSERIIGKDEEGNYRRVRLVTDYKDVEGLHAYMDGVVVRGTPPVTARVHIVDYELGDRESALYQRISSGLLGDVVDEGSWLATVLSGGCIGSGVCSVKSLSRHSSRFVYLQGVVDGSLNEDGTFGVVGGNKVHALLELLRGMSDRGESALIYCSYYTSVDLLLYWLRREAWGGSGAIIEEQSSRSVAVGLTAAACRLRSHFCIITDAATESANYGYINNVIFYDVPVTPKLYFQCSGRICRCNSDYIGNLHIWILRSKTIDAYKLHLLGFKAYMLSRTAVEVTNFPTEYLRGLSEGDHISVAKRSLLWGGGSCGSRRVGVDLDLFSGVK